MSLLDWWRGPPDPLHYELMGFKATDVGTYHTILNEMMKRIVDLEKRVKELEPSD